MIRSCLTSIILLALIAATGYCLWQVRLLRGDVQQLQEQVRRDDFGARDTMIEHARAALDALERGDLRRAQAELDRVGALIDESRSMAVQRRADLRERLEAARKAIAQSSASASQRVEELVRSLARPWRGGPERNRPAAPAEQ